LWSADTLHTSSAVVLADMLKVNRSITRLDLADCRLGAEAGLALASGLAANSAVRYVDLSVNRLGDSAAALMCGNGVTRISLSGNAITDDGAAGIGEQLKFSRKLFEVDLSFNAIGDVGAKHIGSGVASSATVSVINLSGNRLTPVGVGTLCDCIKDNRTIVDIDLSRNDPHLSSDTQHVLRQLLKSNRQRREDIRSGAIQPACISAPPMASSTALAVDQAVLADNVKNLNASADQDITIVRIVRPLPRAAAPLLRLHPPRASRLHSLTVRPPERPCRMCPFRRMTQITAQPL
jgi:Ran GTPase-activating protein (RanGAP) involved in mRNA processing and transport